MFKELASSKTTLGLLSLRRRRELRLGIDIYEIKLDDEFLMSSLFTEAEEELARLGLQILDGRPSDVVVGGLGLGYTARAALAFDCVNSLLVIDALQPVIDWHRQKVLPLGEMLSTDSRCELRQGDFFALAAAGAFDWENPDRRFDAILLDIDHAPDFTLHPSHDGFYTETGLIRLSSQLQPGGVFGLWSNDAPDPAFMKLLQQVFPQAEAHEVEFENPLREAVDSNTVYLARKSEH